MSIAVENLPLSRRGLWKKSYRTAAAPQWFIKISCRADFFKNLPLPRRCRDGF
jgi:hypothetical protein